MAIEAKFIELINAEVDGEISKTDRAELEAFLAVSEEGRALHADVSALAAGLDRLPSLEPPAHLKHLVMNARAGRATPPTPNGGHPGFISRLLATPALGYAGTFAAGVIFTLVLVSSGQISRGAFDDVTGLVGTIADEDFTVPVHGRVTVNKPQVAGTVTLRSTGPILIIDFNLSSRESVEVVAGYADRTIWFNGFAQLESSGTSVAATEGEVSLTVDGERRYAIYLHNPGKRPATINIEFRTGEQVLHRAALDYALTD